jgi:Polysaccharide pyruvyl transferase
MRTLVAGWFSFEQMGATAGDLMARDVPCDWLGRAGHSYDVALASPFSGGVDWRAVDPKGYSHVVFMCGPFGNGWPITEFLPRFAGCRFVGLNLSMLEPLDDWNPFSLLLQRDSSARARPDISMLSRQAKVPVVGVVLRDSQPEYKGKDMYRVANDAVHRLVASREMSVVPVDTRLDRNSTGLRSAAEVESLLARMELVLTTRLHGMVLALKNDVPAIIIDPVGGGGKIQRQAKTIGWRLVSTADALTNGTLQQAFDYCLTEDARAKARECYDRAVRTVKEVREEFVSALARTDAGAED